MKILGFLVAFLLCFTIAVPAHADVTIPPVPLPGGAVTLPPVTLPPLPPVTKLIPGPTILVPGPTQTVTVQVPGNTRTRYVTVPGNTKTIYVTGPTQTKTVRPQRQPLPTPGATVTQTVTAPTATVTRQRVVRHDIVTPSPPSKPHVSAPVAVGYSLLAILIVAGLIILGLWLGYILGYKDSERKEMKFLSALRDQFYYRGKHR